MNEKAGIQLSTKTWHYKLIKYVLGDQAPTPQNMHNLCPYFWLLIFSIIVSPFFAIAKLFVSVFGTVFIKFDEYIDKLLIEPTATSWFDKITDMEAHKIATEYSKVSKIYKRSKQGKDEYGETITIDTFIEKWFQKTYNKSIFVYNKDGSRTYGHSDEYDDWLKKGWNERHDLDKEVEELRRKRREARLQVEESINNTVTNVQNNVKSWTDIIKWTKRVLGLIITGVGLTITFFVVNIMGRAFLWCVENFNGPLIGGVIMWIGISLAAAAIIISIIYVLRLWVIYVAEEGLKLWYAKAIYYPLYYLVYTPIKVIFADILWTFILVNIGLGIAAGSRAIWSGLLNFSGIFGEYFGASYTDYCPGIEWEENSNNSND